MRGNPKEIPRTPLGLPRGEAVHSYQDRRDGLPRWVTMPLHCPPEGVLWLPQVR